MVVQTNLPHCVGTRRRCCFLTKTSVLFSMNHPLSNLIIAQICNATIIIRKVPRNTAHARDWLILLEVLILRRFCDKLFVQSASYINGRITREPSWYFREFAANRLSVLMHPSYPITPCIETAVWRGGVPQLYVEMFHVWGTNRSEDRSLKIPFRLAAFRWALLPLAASFEPLSI